MSKTLTKLFFVSFFLFTFNYPAHSVTHKQARLASISAGTATGLAVAIAILYGSSKAPINTQTEIIATAGGISTAFLTYLCMIKILKKYTPENFLQSIKDKFEKIKHDDLANQDFINDKEILEYLNSKFGNSFANEESIVHLKNLKAQTDKILEELNQIQNCTKSCDLIKLYEELQNNLLFFDELISIKITQVIMAFIKTDINSNLDTLNKQLESLYNSYEIISEMISKIPHKKIFDNAMATLKSQIDKIENLKNLIQIKKIQLIIQESDNQLKDVCTETITDQANQLEYLLSSLDQAQNQLQTMPNNLASKDCEDLLKLKIKVKLKLIESLIKLIEMDYFISTEFETDENLGNMISTKFESPWYLILAKKGLAAYLSKLDYISKNLADVIKFIKENQETDQLKELHTILQEKTIRLIKKVETLMLMIVKNKDYMSQLQTYEQNLVTKKQLEKRIENDKKIETSINNLKQSQDSKFQDISTKIYTLENKIKNYERRRLIKYLKMQSKIDQLQNAIKEKSYLPQPRPT